MHWVEIVTGIAGGLAIFLFGMEFLTVGLKRAAGSRMRYLLGALTTNRFTGVFSGAAVTAVIQSSSVTTVLVVGFISAGLMTLSQSVGVILGADIGGTVTAQIIAFNVVESAYAMVAVGFLLRLARQREFLRHVGTMLLGLGLVFLGMLVMKTMTGRIQETQGPAVIAWMAYCEHPLLGVLFGMLFTAVVQSSAATIGLIIVLAQQGMVTLNGGVALMLGANIGTCITAALAAIGKPPEAVRAAVVHVLIKVVGVGLWIGFVGQLGRIASLLSADLPRQIAHAHTLFNISVTMVLIWFTTPIVLLVRRLVPEHRRKRLEPGEPRHLDPMYLETPDLALTQTFREILRLGGAVQGMMAAANRALLRGEEEELEDIRRFDTQVDGVHKAIVAYLRDLAQKELPLAATRRMTFLLDLATSLENIGDIIEKIQLPLAAKRCRLQLVVNSETSVRIERLLDDVAGDLDAALACLRTVDRESARNLLKEKFILKELAEDAERRIAERIGSDDPDRLELYRLETDIVESARLCHYYVRRLAHAVERGVFSGSISQPRMTVVGA